MATAVGLRSVISKHWTGSLLELDSSRYQANDKSHCLADSDERDYQYWKGIPTDISQIAWASRSKAFNSLAELGSGNARSLDTISMDLGKWPKPNTESNGPNSGASLSFEQLLGLSQLLKFIHGRSPSQTSNRPNKFNSKDADFKDSYAQRRTAVPGWKCALSGQTLLNNQTSSLTNLPNSICADPSIPLDLHDPISLILNRPKRRHYNSESELFLPETGLCESSNELIRDSVPHDQDEDDHAKATSELPKDEVSESASTTSDQNENLTDNCPMPEDSQLFTLVNRIDCAEEPEVRKSDDLASQHCPMMNENDQPHLSHQLNPNEDFKTREISSVEQTTDLTKPIHLQTNQDCTYAPKDSLSKKSNSSSLITSRTSRSNLKIVKSVSFADEIGQCLTETYTFDNDEDSIDVPEYEDFFDDPDFQPCFKLKILKSNNQNRFTRSRMKHTLIDPLFENRTSQYKSPEQQLSPTSEMSPNQAVSLEAQPMWNLTFPQPASQYYEFRHRLECNSVSLESITLTQPGENGDNEHVKLSGTIKVKNLSFEKHVWLRVSTDNWQSFVDYSTNYSPELSTGTWSSPSRFDTFVFLVTLNLSKTQMSNDQKIEFAVRYKAGSNGESGEFWDSNNGRNYVIELKMVRPVWTHVTHTTVQNSKSSDYTTTPSQNMNPYTLDYRPNFDGFNSFTDYRAWRHFAGETSYY